MRRNIAGLIAVLALGCLVAAAPSLAQSTSTSGSTSTDLSGYTGGTTGSQTISTPTTVPSSTAGPAETATATPTTSAPTQLAFTGANALWLIVIGGVLASGAVALLVIDRRSRRQKR